MGFLQCELDKGGIPTGSQVVYNIILPSGSLEDDLFGARTFCSSGTGATAWHFHQTPYSTEGVAGIALGLLGAATGGVAGGLEALLGAMAVLHGGPVYTISSADPSCGTPLDNLFHEMVEAATDPFPPTHVILTGNGEIVDIADDKKCPAASPFVPPGATVQLLPQTSTFPAFDRFTTAATISVPQYWSNAQQRCVAGNDSTTPAGIKVGMAGNGATLALTITGAGFGTLPGTMSPPTSSAVPYIAIQNNTQRWQAGNSLNNDFVTLNISSWTDTAISINGFNFSQNNLVMLPKDNLSVWVCNPVSGQCGGAGFVLAESGSPELNVVTYNANNVNLLYDVKLDGNVVSHALPPGGSTGWRTSLVGSHTVSDASTVPGFSTATFLDGCDDTGNVTLKPGDNQVCRIFNVATTNCSAGQHCCSNVNSKSGCTAGCVSSAVACHTLCPADKNKCCGSALPNGQCDGECISSPRQSCQ